MKPLNLNLTQEQEFFIERFKRQAHNFSKEELANLLIQVQSQCFAYQNAFKSVVKEK